MKTSTCDLHIHSRFSPDGTASIRSIFSTAKKNGLSLISITDHDNMDHASEAERMADQFGINYLPGVEITTAEGDLLAYQIKTLIPAGLSYLETVLRVAEQGGFCIVPHPMAFEFTMNSVGDKKLVEVLKNPIARETILGVEIYNATLWDKHANNLAKHLCSDLGLALFANSDAHVHQVIGAGRTNFKGSTVDDLILACKERSTIAIDIKHVNLHFMILRWVVSYLRSRMIGLLQLPVKRYASMFVATKALRNA